MHRGPYLIANVMTESVSDQPLVMNGLYADLLTSDFDILTHKTIYPGENAMLFDFSEIESESARIIGTSARVFDLSCKENEFTLSAKAAGTIHAKLRLRLPRPIFAVYASDEAGERVDVSYLWDDVSRTALFSYKSKNRKVFIDGLFI